MIFIGLKHSFIICVAKVSVRTLLIKKFIIFIIKISNKILKIDFSIFNKHDI